VEREQNPFDTPVPGQSLTDTPKNYKWENPARFPKLEDSSIHIWKELNKKGCKLQPAKNVTENWKCKSLL